MKILFVLILFLSFISAVEVNFDCPESVEVNEEFECSLQVLDGEGSYDVKVEIEKDEKNIAKIWNFAEEKWESAYYYLKEFINNKEKEVRLIIKEEGEYNGILKLRSGEKREFFDFRIEVTG
ncbi:MAG: hypothetical protein Q8N88_05260, partial [Nanoarchaeota archaeon]|nr:hypothetical protein [Nanoarchaeota archaeon]